MDLQAKGAMHRFSTLFCLEKVKHKFFFNVSTANNFVHAHKMMIVSAIRMILIRKAFHRHIVD